MRGKTMYKLFKREYREDKDDYCWVEVDEGYSQFELTNIKTRLGEGDYFFAQCHQFSVPHKTFKQLCRENPVP